MVIKFHQDTQMEGHTESVMSLTMMSGHELVSAGMDNTIRVWDLNKMQEENVLQGVKANFCVDYSSKRKVLFITYESLAKIILAFGYGKFG